MDGAKGIFVNLAKNYLWNRMISLSFIFMAFKLLLDLRYFCFLLISVLHPNLEGYPFGFEQGSLILIPGINGYFGKLLLSFCRPWHPVYYALSKDMIDSAFCFIGGVKTM